MRRREFITLLGAVASGWPLAARAEQPAMPVIGILNTRGPSDDLHLLAAFGRGLSEVGYSEGQSVALTPHWAEGHYDQLSAFAADLVHRRVEVIFAMGSSPALAAKSATTTIPIVFYSASDPVKSGLVLSLNRPGNNLTGVTTLGVEAGPKLLELMHELVPAATNMALLSNPTTTYAEARSREMQSAARMLGIQLHVFNSSTEREFDAVFENLVRERIGALVIGTDAFFQTRRELLAALALRHGLPSIYQFREYTAAGGMMSYGASLADACRQAGVYVGRILRGAKPADLPVQQAVKLELVINLKTAKALGLEIPPTLLARADEVIE
jgi:putative ABC transport system substrate-binding protein